MASIRKLRDVDGHRIYPETHVEAIVGHGKRLVTMLGEKQDVLVSGLNIKTVNGKSLLGGGGIAIDGSGEMMDIDPLPVRDSNNLVSSGGVYRTIANALFIGETVGTV